MAITTIIPQTTALPTPPNRASDTPVEFYTAADNYNDAIYLTYQPEVNTSVVAMNDWALEANQLAVDVNTDADRAEAAADSVANYKGDWVAGYNTTGYDVGDAVSYGTAGGAYTSKVNANLVEPTDGVETTEWLYAPPKLNSTDPVITGSITEETTTQTSTDITDSSTIQTRTMVADETFTESISDGQYVLFRLTTGGFTAGGIFATDTNWIDATIPTFTTTDDLLLYQVAGVLRIAYVGSVNA